MRIRLLAQIPQGSIPTDNYRFNYDLNINLEGMETKIFEMIFYWTDQGQFEMYPPTVVKDSSIIAQAEIRQLTVSANN